MNKSPESFTKAALFSKLVWDSRGEVPQVTPFESFDLLVATFSPMTARYNSSLDLSFGRAQVNYGVPLTFVDWSNKAWPEKGFLLWRVCLKLCLKLVSWSLTLLHCKVTKLLIHCIGLSCSSGEDFTGISLSHLTEMTPILGITGHRTFKHMWAWCNNRSIFFSSVLNHPLSE